MVKRAFLLGFMLAALFYTPGAWSAEHATVFVYHRFGDSRYPSTNIDADVFESQLEYLKQHQYQVLPISEIVRRLQSGHALPQRCVALTVDDGYSSFLETAMPLLRRYGYPVSLFVNSDAVGGRDYLDWEQLRQLVAEGVEIGNHSSSHPYFVTLEHQKPEVWREQARQDIEQAQQKFSDHLGVVPTLFAYPYGEYSPGVAQLIAELGFTAALAQQSGVISVRHDRYALPRFPMGGGYATLAEFKSKLKMLPLPLTVLAPLTPVVAQQDPPELIFTLETQLLSMSSLRCYVQGQPPAEIEALGAGRYRVIAAQPLAGRRNKYTLTAQGRDGHSWFWFSQLWIHPD